MGFETGKRAWERPTENKVANNEIKRMSNIDLVKGHEGQVKNYIKDNPHLVAIFRSKEFDTLILTAKSPMNAARFVSDNSPEFHLEKIGLDDKDEQATFFIALVRELQKPEYSQ